MVIATEALTAVIMNTPKKLNTVAIMIALRAPMALVETQVAMAFGASVQRLPDTASVNTVTPITLDYPELTMNASKSNNETSGFFF